MTENANDGSRPRTKVARLIREYGLEDLGADLEAYWTGDGVERLSLRDLADLFNRRLLEQALLDAGVSALEGEIEGYYEALADESDSAAVRIETRRRLQEEGVDVERLETDFVTYQAVRTYLQDHRGAEYEPSTESPQIETDLETIQRLLSRTASVTEEKVERLRDTDRIDLGEFRLLIEAQILCQECENQYSAQELLEREGCDCDQ